MKITDNTSKNFNLSEAGHGPSCIKFAFVNKKGETFTPFCKCKDYFNDMFWTHKTNNPVNIYGFKFSPGDDNKELNRRSFTIAFFKETKGEKQVPDEKTMSSISNLLSKFEKSLGFKPTTIKICDDNIYYIINFSSEWSKKPYLLSAFFMFIRMGFSYDGSEDIIKYYSSLPQKSWVSVLDPSYFRSASNKIKDLLNGKIYESENYEKYTSSTIHNYSGLVSCKI